MRRCRLSLRALLFVVLAGCGTQSEQGVPTSISRDEFIEVNVDLREIDASSDSADELRARVLDAHGVTEQEMRSFVEAYSRDLGELAEMWDEIRERQQARADTAVSGDTSALPDSLSQPDGPAGRDVPGPS